MITLIYTGHDEKELTPEALAAIRNSDIFVAEDIFYSPKSRKEKEVNWLSEGLADISEVDLEGSIGGDFLLKVFQTLHESGVKVYLEKSNSKKEYGDTEKLSVEALELFCGGKPYQAMKKYMEYCKATAVIDNQRDENLAEFLASLQKSNIERNICSLRGSIHTSVYHRLSKQHVPVRRIFSHMPYLYDVGAEISRRYSFGKAVDDLTAFQYLALVEIYGCFRMRRIFDSKHDVICRADKIARMLTEDEVVELSKRISENWWPQLGNIILNDVTEVWLEEKGHI